MCSVMKHDRKAACLVALLLALVPSACRPSPEPIRVEVVQPGGAGRGPTAVADASIIAAAQGRVTLVGAGREVVSFMLAVAPGSTRPTHVDVEALTSAVGVIPPSAIHVFRVHRVRVPDWPGWHMKFVRPSDRVAYPLDVLVPLDAPRGGLTDEVTFGREVVLWVEVTIPADAPAGRYAGRLTLRSDVDASRTVEIDVAVRSFVLPAEEEVPLIGEVDYAALMRHHVTREGRPYVPPPTWQADPARSEAVRVLDATMRMLREHGVDAVVTGLEPRLQLNARGRAVVEWDGYDELIWPYVDGYAYADRRAAAWWPLPFSETFPARPEVSGGWSQGFEDIAAAYLRECAEHFAERGWLARSYLLPGDVRRGGSAGLEPRLARVSRRADDRILNASTGFPQDLRAVGATTPTGALTGVATASDAAALVDVWAPPAQFYDPGEMREQREAGRRTWVTLDRPPYSGTLSIAGSQADVRGVAWQARRLEAGAVRLGVVNPWSAPPGEATPQRVIEDAPDALLYPGSAFGLTEPVASVRLKMLRRGVQDGAYLRLLRQHDLAHVADTMIASLVRYAGSDAYDAHFADGRSPGWSRDRAMWESARRIMSEELTRKLSGGPEDDLAADIRWRRMMEAARVVDVSPGGVRVDFGVAPEEAIGRWTLTSLLRVCNHRRLPIEGELRLAGLPQGWEATEAFRVFGPIPPGQSQWMTLSARSGAPPVFTDGAFDVPVQLTQAHAPAIERRQRVAALTAHPVEHPITIDGNLSDWPVAGTHVAAGFRLISALDDTDTAATENLPAHATVCYVACDPESLFFAVRCKDDRWEGGARRGNVVRYDDLVPRGGDLIELVFDPARTGSCAPDDLFHVVLMRSGGQVAERGVNLGVACGSWRPWAIELEWSSVEHETGWTVEVRIPRAVLAAAGAAPRVLGFNITRLDAERDEFSTWSAVRGNAYDPTRLGNLILPPTTTTATGDVSEDRGG
ncbi:MAG: DUF4091 domain-containing protein [Phycisphaerae bacterium]|nr:MAG: DUF4091 domain-containing protein [Planctomycetota bacterium]KAB2944259.1 MAG: DUF4091 domain-containing protein [Phycisphaerae bacterium]MBE7456370.1 DUF4091 domain-containing protein [Planctomycetia bacterium]MCK6465700.1 DUF4091 domain-containing protein [Phycisphaerae bacterium]MCL4718488.1 DUF4091 domain-containing protein [Phycisphaerae bacterium]